MEILAVINQEDIKLTADLAAIIWSEHYTDLIGQEQVDYMIKNFQSETVISEQIGAGCEYFLVKYDNKYVGYFAIEPQFILNQMFLSKLYVKQDFRGHGIARQCVQFIVDRTKALNLSKIYLTVNKYNQIAIESYLKLGFVKVKSFTKDIGDGFIMDDYGMEKMVV
jgi:ribosomal protein S18 acetylase RimI-like enzyme